MVKALNSKYSSVLRTHTLASKGKTHQNTRDSSIDPLDEKETEQFIAFRIHGAQAPKDLFEPEALALVAAHCHGNRREIMNMGTLLLSEAYYRKEKTVSAELIADCDLIA